MSRSRVKIKRHFGVSSKSVRCRKLSGGVKVPCNLLEMWQGYGGSESGWRVFTIPSATVLHNLGGSPLMPTRMSCAFLNEAEML